MFMVVVVAQRVECLLPAGRRDVQALAGLKINAGDEDMDMASAIIFTVKDCRIRNTITRQSGKGGALEVVQHLTDLLIGRIIFWRECDHAGRVTILKVKAICYLGHGHRITAQHLDLGSLDAVVVMGSHEVTGGCMRVACAVVEELNQHQNLLRLLRASLAGAVGKENRGARH